MNLLRISVGQGGNQLNYSLSNYIFDRGDADVFNQILCPFSKDTCKSVLIDSESKVINKYFKSDKLQKVYNSSNTLVNSGGRGNNWALGYSTEYKEKNRENIVEESLEKIMKMIERCDFINGFSFLHSLNGGTGSGLTSRLIETLRDEFPKFYFVDFPIFGFEIENTPLSTFNQFFTLCHTYKCLDYLFFVKNEKIATKQISCGSFNFEDINQSFSSLYYDLFLEVSLKKKGNMLIDNLPLLRNIKVIDFMNTQHNYLQPFEILESKLKSIFSYPTVNDLINNNLLLSTMAIVRSQTRLRDFSKEINPFLTKSLGGIVTRTENVYSPKINQNIVEMNIFGANLGAVHLFEDLIQNVIQKVQSRAYLHWYEKYGVTNEDILLGIGEIEEIIDSYKDAYSFLKN